MSIVALASAGEGAGRGRLERGRSGVGDTRLVACDAFSRYLVLTERRGAATQLRVLDRHTGAQRLTQTASPHVTLELADNPEYQAASVTVRHQPLTAGRCRL